MDENTYPIGASVTALVDPFGDDELSTPQPATIIAVYNLDDYAVRLDDGREFTVAGVDIQSRNDRAAALAELQQQYPDGVTRSPDA